MATNRPTCQTVDCTNDAALININKKTGKKVWRKWCNKCHNKKTAAKHGLNSIAEITAKKLGFDDVTDYKNSTHPYLKYRKKYCENKTDTYWDDLLSYLSVTTGKIIDMPDNLKGACTSTIKMKAQLQVDHKDGNSENNIQSNLHTLCSNCHVIKTLVCGDGQTIGRKTLQQQKLATKSLITA